MSDAGGGRGHERGELTPAEREAFAKRASDLGRRLESKAAPARPRGPASGGGPSASQGYALAFRFAADLIAGVGVGGFIGWLLDGQFGTRPWLMVVFIVLGFAAGMLNVIRGAQSAQRKVEAAQRAAPSVRDGDDDET